jgi:hypothetical protein
MVRPSKTLSLKVSGWKLAEPREVLGVLCLVRPVEGEDGQAEMADDPAVEIEDDLSGASGTDQDVACCVPA